MEIRVNHGWISEIQCAVNIDWKDGRNFVLNYAKTFDASIFGYLVNMNDLVKLKQIDNIILTFPILMASNEKLLEDLDRISRLNYEFGVIIIDIVNDASKDWITKSSYIPHCIMNGVFNCEEFCAIMWNRVKEVRK